jgi:hypothetical protein
MHRRTSALLAALLVTAAPLAAQKLTSGEGPLRTKGAVTVGPVGSFNFGTSDGTGNGFTLGGQATYGLGVVALIGEITYNPISVDGGGDANGVAFDAGARVALPVVGLYAGGVTGYWSGDLDDFDVVPLVGFQLGPVDLEARYKGLFGDADWFSIGATVHFRIK